MRATQALIHLDRLQKNIAAVRNRIGPKPLICMPVKADGYGHGAIPVAHEALSSGVAVLAVASVQEGIELRKAGITAPILLFSIPLPEELDDLAAATLSPFVADKDSATALAAAADRAGVRLPVHLKIDTGMGRVGCRPEAAAALAAYLVSLPSLHYVGTATHLARADALSADAMAYTQKQLARFTQALDAIRTAGFDTGIVHAANSGAVFLHTDAYFDMVRPGIVLYGYPPSEELASLVQLEPVMELRTAVVFIKKVLSGTPLSYGGTWIAPADRMIATLPVGYGDGLPRALSGNLQVLIRGALYPLAGRICMDQCMVDLGPDTDVRRWDPVTVFGGTGEALTAGDLAAKLHTIPYEITCNINKRVPRVYCAGVGKCSITDCL
ncbi:MAG: alanine racemase [Treponema sp.]|nr:alanine racemase [Treponema sp.]